MNQFPELKSFLKDGEAESYHGVEITYIAGRTAILSILEDGELKEKINLHELNDKVKLRALFKEKGFRKKTPEELVTEHENKATGSITSQERVNTLIQRRDERIAQGSTIRKSRDERRQERADEKEMKMIEREFLGSTLSLVPTLQLYGVIAAAAIVLAGFMSCRKSRRKRFFGKASRTGQV